MRSMRTGSMPIGPPPPPALGDPAARCAPRAARSWRGSTRSMRRLSAVSYRGTGNKTLRWLVVARAPTQVAVIFLGESGTLRLPQAVWARGRYVYGEGESLASLLGERT
jgi:hypothetical protein